MITLYTAPTGNGYRVAIMLEELGLPYEPHTLDFMKGDFTSPEFLKVNPAGQIPAIVDEEGPDGMPYALAESLAILQYLADKSGKLRPETSMERAEAGRWSAIVAGGIQPEQFNLFMMNRMDPAGHAPMIERCTADLKRHLAMMNTRLETSDYLTGDRFTYVDVLAITNIVKSLPAVGMTLEGYPAIERWRDAVLARPGVQRGFGEAK